MAKQKTGQVCEMAGSDLLCTWQFHQQRIDGSDMECRDELFQFREEDIDQTGNRCFQPGTILNLGKSVCSLWWIYTFPSSPSEFFAIYLAEFSMKSLTYWLWHGIIHIEKSYDNLGNFSTEV